MVNQVNGHDAYYFTLEEPVKSCLLVVKEIILSTDDRITTDLKYGMPFFCFRGKMLCYVWKDTSEANPYIGFTDGQQMKSPYLIAGKRKRMAIFPVDPEQDVPVKAIQILVRQAIEIKQL